MSSPIPVAAPVPAVALAVPPAEAEEEESEPDSPRRALAAVFAFVSSAADVRRAPDGPPELDAALMFASAPLK